MSVTNPLVQYNDKTLVLCNDKCFVFQVTKCFFEDGFHDTSVYLMEGLTFGHVISGPAIIIDKNR